MKFVVDGVWVNLEIGDSSVLHLTHQEYAALQETSPIVLSAWDSRDDWGDDYFARVIPEFDHDHVVAVVSEDLGEPGVREPGWRWSVSFARRSVDGREADELLAKVAADRECRRRGLVTP